MEKTMPSGGYGLNEEDGKKLERAFKENSLPDTDPDNLHGMIYEWAWAYVSARASGASPDEAATAAYTEWDL
jgi:hypothetical protein